jgi:hypothetical protein
MIVAMAATVGTLFAVWIVTGVKLMRLARRTRALPEFLLGLSLLTMAGLGYPLSVVAQFAGRYAVPVTLLASTCSNTGIALLIVFTARVFHDGSRLAWAAVGALVTLLVIQAAGYVLGQALAATPADKVAATLRWGAGSLALSGAAWGWTAVESLRFHALLRRRVQLGLADPVVANRMLLWGLMAGLAVAAVVIDTALLYAGGEQGRLVLLPLVTAAAGLLVSVCMVLAFWPPAGYLARVRGTAARA